MKVVTPLSRRIRSSLAHNKQLSAVKRFFRRRPLLLVASLVAVLFGLIVIGNIIRQPKAEDDGGEKQAIPVRTYTIGSAPSVTVQGKVEKDNVITISAQAGGIVNKVLVTEGQSISRGTTVVSLGSNYLGGNTASIQRQIAQKQYDNIEQTLPTQKELIQKQREIAEKTDANSDELRRITDQSLGETRDLIHLNDTILQTLDKNLQQYEATNSAGMNETAILSTRQLKAQLVSAQSQLRSALRANEYQSAGDKPPAELSNLQREITVKQLEIQEKSLELSKEVAALQLKLARVGESVMYPASPIAAVVERVHVKPGQMVSPGTPLVTVSGKENVSSLIVFLSSDLAKKVNPLEPATLLLANKSVPVSLHYVSQEATEGTLYTARYLVEPMIAKELSNTEYVSLSLPVGYAQTGTTIPFIPLDAVYQTNQKDTVYLLNQDGKAESRVVRLGQVVGSYVEVIDGIKDHDEVILDRVVVAGDPVVRK